MKININSQFDEKAKNWFASGTLEFDFYGPRKFKLVTECHAAECHAVHDCAGALNYTYSVVAAPDIESEAAQLNTKGVFDNATWIEVAIKSRLMNSHSPFRPNNSKVVAVDPFDDLDEPLPPRQCQDEGTCESCQ